MPSVLSFSSLFALPFCFCFNLSVSISIILFLFLFLFYIAVVFPVSFYVHFSFCSHFTFRLSLSNFHFFMFVFPSLFLIPFLNYSFADVTHLFYLFQRDYYFNLRLISGSSLYHFIPLTFDSLQCLSDFLRFLYSVLVSDHYHLFAIFPVFLPILSVFPF